MTQIVSGIPGFISQRNFRKGLSLWENEQNHTNNRYEGWKNEHSLNMISTDGDSTGRKAEMMLFSELEEMGFNVEIGNGKEDADLYLCINNKWHGVEVKTSRPRENGTYQFSGIQPLKSTITILMFIRPEGLECRVVNTKKLCAWANRYYKYIEEGKKPGYSIPFNRFYANQNLHGIDLFRGLTKGNTLLALNNN